MKTISGNPACYLMVLASAIATCSTAWGQEEPSVASEYRGAIEPTTLAEVFGQGVRETEWRSPTQEQAGFHLPTGFSIELFASEPQIAKPLNMAFDHRGRLWISNTLEYPYPAKEGEAPRDSILILEDTDGDGVADRSQTFADQLNIPMGLLPVADGVICFSIPNIWHLKDTNGDDVADERIKLLGPFDTTRDTHGMINAMRRGSDGWIYACHGFNNQSTVTARDGSKITLISGNTFRFREDGSQIQQFTSGQVNPFGMTQDEFGNWYTADCHSKPLTALLPGGCYPSFGRPHDGMGFAPEMMSHLHGSTAISGLAYYLDAAFPKSYQRKFYSGNVMTSRINCNSIEWTGSTAHAIEQPDFLTSDDPWFRPVDIQIGPDGAMYVADFYNKIIGHYEVPLEHAGRDRTSGRIWRISYVGAGEALSRSTEKDALPSSDDNWDQSAAAKLRFERSVAAGLEPTGRLAKAIWLERTGQLDVDGLRALDLGWLDDHEATLLLRAARGWPSELQSPLREIALTSWHHNDNQRLRAAVEFLGVAGHASDVWLLLATGVDSTASQDTALLHSSRLAVRRLMQDDEILRAAEQVFSNPMPERQSERDMLLDILPGVGTPAAGQALLKYLEANAEVDEASLANTTQLLLPTLNAQGLTMRRLLGVYERASLGRPMELADRYSKLCTEFAALHGEITEPMREFGRNLIFDQLAPELARRNPTEQIRWLDGKGKSWPKQDRFLPSGKAVSLRSTHPLGETYTGRLRSEVFRCPPQLSFWIAGHNGRPDEPNDHTCSVRLIAEQTQAVLERVEPPRSDVAATVQWNLTRWQGQPVWLEIVDESPLDAYAWLAAGQFSMDSLNIDDEAPSVESLDSLLRAGCLRGHSDEAWEMLDGLQLEPRTATRLKAGLAYGAGQPFVATLFQQAAELGRFDLAASNLLDTDQSNAVQFDTLQFELAKELCASATSAQQSDLAKKWTNSATGCELAAKLIRAGYLNRFAMAGVEHLPKGVNEESLAFLQRALSELPAGASSGPPVEIRVTELDWSMAQASEGKNLFEQHCAVCHQLAGVGKTIGPQLDGAIVRGVLRLGEDILDPNRNVDQAFRQTSLLLSNGSVVAGLAQDQPDGTVRLTTADGKTTRFGSEQIEDRRTSQQSFMPSNFAELLNDQQLGSLLLFLTETSTKP